ncbi:hypothetical protein [Bacillus cereus]|uniref:hypothetical protein n=1 Tax=Bacillus cereus TaxID=1396 RepID=UPI002AC2AA15|nr:hypothetical protein [Bacillus cereus]MDZ4496025.1 hypothetical protein [Bacillus cereus]
MLKIIGALLIVYSVISIAILVILRKDAIKFWDTQVEKFKNVIKEGKAIIPKLSEGARASRNGADHINDLAEHLEQDIPSALQKVVETLDGVLKTLSKLPQEIKDFVTKASYTLKDSIVTVTKFIDYITKKTIPNTSKTLRELSRDLDQPLFWLTVEALVLLEQDDNVPNEVIVKLNSMLERPYETEIIFRENLEKLLDKDEINQYAGKIVFRGKNPEYDEGLVETIEEARVAIHHIGSESLPAVAESVIKMQEPVSALLVLTGIIAGPLVPFAFGVRSTCDTFLTVLGGLGGSLKIEKGKIGSIKLPPWDIKVGIPAGSLFYKDLRGSLPVIRVPSSDVNIIDVDAGEWLDTALPPSDIELFNGQNLVKGFKDVRDRADELIDTVRGATFNFDIRDKLQEAGDKLKVTASKILELADNKKRLPNQVKKLKKQAAALANQAREFEEAAIEIDKMIDEVEKQITDILNTIHQLADSSVIAIENTSDRLKELADTLRTLSLDEELEDLKNLANDIRELANSIDKGDAIGTKGKTDLVQQLANIFKAVCESIPARKNIVRLFNGVFGFLIVIHIAFLATGIVLIRGF